MMRIWSVPMSTMRIGNMLILFIVVCSLCLLPRCSAEGKKFDNSGNITYVRNENELIQELERGIQLHKKYYRFYYPGILGDFKKYAKNKPAYSNFFDKLSKKNGYLSGIVSGYCIMIFEKEENSYVSIQFHFITTKWQEKQIDRFVKKVKKQVKGETKIEKIRWVHDYLIRYLNYQEDIFNPYFAIKRKKGNCMTFSLLFQRILQELNLPCIYIKGENHAWNMVKIGKYWYNVDLTYDEQFHNDVHFLKADQDFTGHRRPKLKWIRQLKKARYSY